MSRYRTQLRRDLAQHLAFKEVTRAILSQSPLNTLGMPISSVVLLEEMEAAPGIAHRLSTTLSE